MFQLMQICSYQQNKETKKFPTKSFTQLYVSMEVLGLILSLWFQQEGFFLIGSSEWAWDMVCVCCPEAPYKEAGSG